ncbi:MAG: hypothetical protein GIKADHBN_00164 [Phycisphaerales bacterium]|nr:hypothetical protein [Phycisphaerales bacterium]
MDGQGAAGGRKETVNFDVPDRALVALLYEELKLIARERLAAERAGHTLTATALVHEVFLKLQDRQRPWPGREYFLLAAAEAMRRVLIDHARRRKAAKRGAGRAVGVGDGGLDDLPFVQIDDDLDVAELDSHLERLAIADPEAHRVVMLRYFAGLTAEDTALLLGVDRRTVTRRWNAARAWLYERMSSPAGGGPAPAGHGDGGCRMRINKPRSTSA